MNTRARRSATKSTIQPLLSECRSYSVELGWMSESVVVATYMFALQDPLAPRPYSPGERIHTYMHAWSKWFAVYGNTANPRVPWSMKINWLANCLCLSKIKSASALTVVSDEKGRKYKSSTDNPNVACSRYTQRAAPALFRKIRYILVPIPHTT